MKIILSTGILIILIAGLSLYLYMNTQKEAQITKTDAQDGVTILSYKGDTFRTAEIPSSSTLIFIEKPIKRFNSITSSSELNTSAKTVSAENSQLYDIMADLRKAASNTLPETTFFMVDGSNLSSIPAAAKFTQKVVAGKKGVAAIVPKSMNEENLGHILDTLRDSRWDI